MKSSCTSLGIACESNAEHLYPARPAGRPHHRHYGRHGRHRSRLAKGFAAHGATVIALARNLERLESLFDEIVSAAIPNRPFSPRILRAFARTMPSNWPTPLAISLGASMGFCTMPACWGPAFPSHYDRRVLSGDDREP